MKYILALDQGTTSSRAIIFDQAGGIRAVAQKEFQQYFPQPGWVEHDANEIWATQSGVAAEAMAKAGLKPRTSRPSASPTSARPPWSGTARPGEPVCNAIVWQDRRTAAFCDQLKRDGLEDLIRKKTGLVIDAYFSGSKLRWILDNVPGARARGGAGRAGLRHRRHLADLETDRRQTSTSPIAPTPRAPCSSTSTPAQWDDELLEDSRRPALDPAARSRVRARSTANAETSSTFPSRASAATSRPRSSARPASQPGMVKNTYGTGCFMLMNTGDEADRRRRTISDHGGVEDRRQARIRAGRQRLHRGRGGAMAARRTGHHQDTPRRSRSSPPRVPDNGGVYLVPAFAGLGAPHWDPYARGTISGLTRGTTGGAYRARRAGRHRLPGRRRPRGDGSRLRHPAEGAARRWRRERQQPAHAVPGRSARRAGRAVRRSGNDGPGRGLPGRARGRILARPAEIAAQWKVDRRFEPSMKTGQRDKMRETWAKALERSKSWEKPA